MTSLLVTGAVCAAATAASGALLVPALRRRHRLDVPNHRSSHTVPTPRGGGLAVIAGMAVACILALATGAGWPSEAWTLLGAALVLGGVGFVDDTRGIDPLPRLLAQVVVGGAAGAVVGGLWGAVLGSVVVPAAVNMVNFMDGINGICSAHSAVGGLGALLAGSALGSHTLSVIGALTLGGSLGFLPWNAPRARVFLGDVGSYLLGGLAGLCVTVALTSDTEGWRPEVIGYIAAPYLLFAADTASTLVRRRRLGEPLFEAHRSHVYQRLVHSRGLPHWIVSFGMALVALVVTLTFRVGWVSGLAAAVVATAGYLVVAPRREARAGAS